jgi:hypothetical protein
MLFEGKSGNEEEVEGRVTRYIRGAIGVRITHVLEISAAGS